MKKCCCIILAAFLALAFVTTTLASDVVLEFYLQAGESSVVPMKNLHYMLFDSNKHRVLDDRLEDEVGCKVSVSLETGEYSLFVEELTSNHSGHYGNTNFFISSQSDLSMIFLLDNSGLKLLEDVHSCTANLACTYGEECVCDDKCICKRIHNQASLKRVGQKKEKFVLSSEEFSTEIIKNKVEGYRTVGQPTCLSSYVYSNLGSGTGCSYCGEAACYSTGGSGAWGALGLLGLLSFIRCPEPGPVTEESVNK